MPYTLMLLIRRRLHLLWKSLTSVSAAAPRAPELVSKMGKRWGRGKTSETQYWRGYLAGRGGVDLRKRLDPRLPLQECVTRWLDPSAERVAILDVGAGPLTTLGKVWEGGPHVDIKAVDVLADTYNEILDALGIVPLVRTVGCATEELVERFGGDSFDVVYIENALDHHADVVSAVEQMLRVAKPGGHVIMRHARNEAETQGYSGLHQWNLCIEDGDYVLWNREVRTSLDKEFAHQAAIVHLERLRDPWELVVLKKGS